MLNGTELRTLKWLILCYVDFISIKKKKYKVLLAGLCSWPLQPDTWCVTTAKDSADLQGSRKLHWCTGPLVCCVSLEVTGQNGSHCPGEFAGGGGEMSWVCTKLNRGHIWLSVGSKVLGQGWLTIPRPVLVVGGRGGPSGWAGATAWPRKGQHFIWSWAPQAGQREASL